MCKTKEDRSRLGLCFQLFTKLINATSIKNRLLHVLACASDPIFQNVSIVAVGNCTAYFIPIIRIILTIILPTRTMANAFCVHTKFVFGEQLFIISEMLLMSFIP